MALSKECKESGKGVASQLKDDRKTGVEEVYEQARKAYEEMPKPVVASDRMVESKKMQAKTAEMIADAGFGIIDVREVRRNPKNDYSLDEGSIQALADLIYTSKNTTPIVVREIPSCPENARDIVGEEGNEQILYYRYEILDGERRTRAHLLLGERYGDHYYMIPARVFERDALSESDAEYILHAENIGQRRMTTLERAMGVAAVKDRILKMRKSKNPEAPEGAMGTVLAKQFGFSEAQISYLLSVLEIDEAAQEQLNEGNLRLKDAAQFKNYSPEEQQAMAAALKSGEMLPKQVGECLKYMKAGASVSDAIAVAIAEPEDKKALEEARSRLEDARRRLSEAEEELERTRIRKEEAEARLEEAFSKSEAEEEQAVIDNEAALDASDEAEKKYKEAKLEVADAEKVIKKKSNAGRKLGSKNRDDKNAWLKKAIRALGEVSKKEGDVDPANIEALEVLIANLSQLSEKS